MKSLLASIFLGLLFACTKFGKNVTIKGRVYDPVSGEGVAGAEIWLQKGTAGLPGANKTIKKAITDADGYYRIDKLTLANTSVLAVNYGDRYPIGWWTGSTYSSYGAYPVQRGKIMHLDYHAVGYGRLLTSIHNVNCGGNSDTLIFKRTYITASDITVFQPFILTGCVNNPGAFAEVPSGDYLISWEVIRNGINNQYSHVLHVYPNQDNTFNIDY